MRNEEVKEEVWCKCRAVRCGSSGDVEDGGCVSWEMGGCVLCGVWQLFSANDMRCFEFDRFYNGLLMTIMD